MTSDLYFRQLLAGRDFARANPVARQLLNFSYVIGSRRTRECVFVDPAWDVAGLLAVAAADDMNVVGALATHWHPDHVGGDLYGHDIEGAARFVALAQAKLRVHRAEADGVRKVTGLSVSDLETVEGGDHLRLGDVDVEFVHTPGHTPGSQCFLVNGTLLVAGDTLFVQGCGRVDLPGGDPGEMYLTLTQRLAKLPDTTVLYPGHDYGPTPVSTLGEERATSVCFRVSGLDDWRRLMG